MTDLVYVTNNSDKELVSEYSYKEYKFPVGKTVEVPLKAAQHILGYGQENKEPYLARLGFIRLHSDLEQGLEKLAKFDISSEAPVEKNRSLPSAVGVVPLHVEKRAGGKSSHARAA
jgi:hypothetical protein